MSDYTDLWVCTDCYFAHHYGTTWMSREANGDLYGPWTAEEREELIGDHTWVWYAGESDEPADREPLGLIDGKFEVTDNTCSNHYYGQNPEHGEDDAFGTYTEPCDYCGQRTDEDGIDEFSSRSCHGCGSMLGGSRHRLALWIKEDA